ncbi:unnamed protein product, partial [Meganyctiphanes norvegica]
MPTNSSKKVVERKHNDIKSEEGSYLHEKCQNSIYVKFEVPVKEDIEGNEAPMLNQEGDITCKEELEIKEEPINFTEENYQYSQHDEPFPQISNPINHQGKNTSKNPYQCSHCDQAFSFFKNLIKHQTVHSGVKTYQCCLCDNAFYCNSSLTKHHMT